MGFKFRIMAAANRRTDLVTHIGRVLSGQMTLRVSS
jgi:hypothetical protein